VKNGTSTVNVDNLTIVCMNDQVFPLWETDAEQVVAMMSAFADSGVKTMLFLPRMWGKGEVTTDEIKQYYEVAGNFSVITARSLFPCLRFVEKLAHGLCGVLCRSTASADLLYTRNLPTALIFLLLARKPLVYETYRPWPDQLPILRPIIRWMTRHRRFLAGVFHSRLTEESYVVNGMPREKSLVAYNGFDPQRMRPVLTRDAARKLLGATDDQHIVTYTGTMTLNKGVGTLLEMAAILTEVQFWLVGSRGRNEVEVLAESLTNIKIIPWKGFAETAPYLYAADVLIIPPTPLPLKKVGTTVLPMKTFLYMAAGRPIFGMATPDMRELLTNRVNAVLADEDADLAKICQLLNKLLHDRQEQRSLAERALAESAKYTWRNRGFLIRDFLLKQLDRQGHRRMAEGGK
jgi:glycosyltransferase involved in cell wall biosynthesis